MAEFIEIYVIQDSRQYVGNDLLFWRNGGGYTTDLEKAELFTKKQAVAINQDRASDIPWTHKYLFEHAQQTVDMQNINNKTALLGLGIKLRKPEKRKKYSKLKTNCISCGRFVYSTTPQNDCKYCGTSNDFC